MSAKMSSRPARRAAPQRGFILVAGMLFLVIMTMVALAMFRGTGLMDRITANARDKQRAFEAAQTTLQYAEWWLSTHTPGTPSACGALQSGDVVANIHVCSAVAFDPASTTGLTTGFTHTPPNMVVSAGGGVANATDINYSQLPAFYIEYLGKSAAGASTYQITAVGYGGDASSMSIVRSTFQLSSSVAGGGPGSGVGGL